MATWHHILLPTAQGSGPLAAQRVGLPNLHYQYVLVDSKTFHTHLTIQYSPFNEVLSINNGEDYTMASPETVKPIYIVLEVSFQLKPRCNQLSQPHSV